MRDKFAVAQPRRRFIDIVNEGSSVRESAAG